MDLVDRLRKVVNVGYGQISPLRLEAADEIEALRKSAAEIERMHLALSQIIDSDDLDFIKARALVALPEK